LRKHERTKSHLAKCQVVTTGDNEKCKELMIENENLKKQLQKQIEINDIYKNIIDTLHLKESKKILMNNVCEFMDSVPLVIEPLTESHLVVVEKKPKMEKVKKVEKVEKEKPKVEKPKVESKVEKVEKIEIKQEPKKQKKPMTEDEEIELIFNLVDERDLESIVSTLEELNVSGKVKEWRDAFLNHIHEHGKQPPMNILERLAFQKEYDEFKKTEEKKVKKSKKVGKLNMNHKVPDVTLEDAINYVKSLGL
jgi:hypothetical protein